MSDVVVSFEGLTKTFPGVSKPALDAVSGEFRTGVITGLGIGSWIAVVVASLAAVIGALRWRRRRVSCETKRADAETGSSSAAIGGMTLDPRAGR